MTRRSPVAVAVVVLLLAATPGTAQSLVRPQDSQERALTGLAARPGAYDLRSSPTAASRSWTRPSLVAPSPPRPVTEQTAQPTIPTLRASGSQVPDARVPDVRRGEVSASGTANGLLRTDVESHDTTAVLSAPQAYALRLVGAVQFACLRPLWQRESGWRADAANAHSTAYGIAQLLTETSSDWRQQITRGVAYIKGRYGSACDAWAFWKGHLWY